MKKESREAQTEGAYRNEASKAANKGLFYLCLLMAFLTFAAFTADEDIPLRHVYFGVGGWVLAGLILWGLLEAKRIKEKGKTD